MTDSEERANLRYYVAHLVRIWTAFSVIRRERSAELISVFQDVCSDKLRNMLHELANKKRWTLGFAPDRTTKYKRLFDRLLEANKWFEGRRNRLHYRNCAASHLQPLNRADHMFQTFGYKDHREWKHLTKGVAACLAMMKIIDDEPFREFWRTIRMRVKGMTGEQIPVEFEGKHMNLEIPIEVEALLQSYRLPGQD